MGNAVEMIIGVDQSKVVVDQCCLSTNDILSILHIAQFQVKYRVPLISVVSSRIGSKATVRF